MSDWGGQFENAGDADELNGMIPEIGKLDSSLKANVGRLLVKVGKAKGFEWDKGAKQFKTLTSKLAERRVEAEGAPF